MLSSVTTTLWTVIITVYGCSYQSLTSADEQRWGDMSQTCIDGCDCSLDAKDEIFQQSVNSSASYFPNLDYALLGYDVMKGYPKAHGLDPGFRHPIFKVNYSSNRYTADLSVRLPDGYDILSDIACDVSFKSQVIKTSQQLQSSLAASAKVEASGSGFFVEASFRASAEYKTSDHQLSNMEKVFIMSEANCQRFYLSIDDLSPPPLADSFVKWVERLNATEDPGLYDKFIAYYGTHFLHSAIFGARFTHEHSMTSDSFKELQQSSSSLSVEAQASLFSSFTIGGGFDFSDSQSSAAESFSQYVETKTSTVGSRPPQSGSAMEWAATTIESPVPVRYGLRSLDELLTPAYLARYGVFNVTRISEQVQLAVIRYQMQLLLKMTTYCPRNYAHDEVIVFPNLCLDGNTEETYDDGASCMQACLKNEDCMAVSLKNGRTCNLTVTHLTISAVAVDAECESILFPKKLARYTCDPSVQAAYLSIENLNLDGYDNHVENNDGPEACSTACYNEQQMDISVYYSDSSCLCARQISPPNFVYNGDCTLTLTVNCCI